MKKKSIKYKLQSHLRAGEGVWDISLTVSSFLLNYVFTLQYILKNKIYIKNFPTMKYSPSRLVCEMPPMDSLWVSLRMLPTASKITVFKHSSYYIFFPEYKLNFVLKRLK